MPETTQRATINFTAFAAKVFAVLGAIGLATVAWQKFSQTIKAGAEVDLITRRFDRLATTIGTTGDALRRDLEPAMQGLVSDVKAMSFATDFLALGLVDTHDQAVRLARVAAQLGFNMNHLVLTMTNLTVLRFDQLGIRVDGFREKVEALEQSGLDATAAFREAFIEQAEQQLEIVGSRAEFTAGKIDILTASVENFTNRTKVSLTEAAIPFLDFLLRGAYAADQASIALQKYSEALDEEKLADQRAAVKDLEEILTEAGKAIESATALFPLQTAEQSRQVLDEFIIQVIQGKDSLGEMILALEEVGFQINKQSVEFAGFITDFEELEALAERARLRQISEDYAEIDARLTDLIITQGDLIAQFRELTTELELTPQMIDHLLTKLGGFEEALDFLQRLEDPTTFFDELGKSIEDVRFDALLEQVGLTNDEFQRLELTVGDTQKAIDLLESAGEDLFGRIERPALQARFEPIPEDLQELGDLFEDFQSDLSDIVDRETDRREQIEEESEKRRNELIKDYGARRAQEERDWQRSRARADRRLQRSIERVQEDSLDRQQELREEADRDLEDLERDHLKRMAEIIANADFQLEEAASRLDARAVAAIERQRDKALKDEQDDYKDQRKEIKRELKERLEEEKEAAQERIEELNEFHEERQKEEEEDRQFRLQQLEDEHRERLQLLEDQKNDRLREIRDQANEEAREREQDYIDQRRQLTDHWILRDSLERTYRDNLLAAEANFWQARINMIPGTTGDEISVPGGGGGTGTGGAPGGGGDMGGQKPSRFWLERTVISIAKPPTTDAALVWYRWMEERSDAELAAWIERHSEIDVPGYARGIRSTPGGLALIGEEGPELVNLPEGARVYDARTSQRMMGNITVDTIQISVLEAQRPGDTAREVRREMTRIFEELAA